MGKHYGTWWCTLMVLIGVPFIPVSAAPEKYTLDPTHTTIVFFIKHAGFSDMVGVFHKVDGTLLLDHNQPEKSTVEITIDPESVQTSSTRLDYELQGERYFHSKKYARIQFKSTKVERMGSNGALVTGKLLMLGAVQPVTLKVTMNKEGEMFLQQRVGFSGSGELKRSGFGMLESIPLVGDNVRFLVEAEFVKAPD